MNSLFTTTFLMFQSCTKKILRKVKKMIDDTQVRNLCGVYGGLTRQIQLI